MGMPLLRSDTRAVFALGSWKLVKEFVEVESGKNDVAARGPGAQLGQRVFRAIVKVVPPVPMMVFERHIVYPNGHREIEGVTPKQLPAPATPDASGT
jgi:hypothetical protein